MDGLSHIFTPLDKRDRESRKVAVTQPQTKTPLIEKPIKQQSEPPTARVLKSKERTYKERSDKRKAIKFPVSPKQRQELRINAKHSPVSKTSQKNETIYNTYLLAQALDRQHLYPEHYPKLIYQDTGQYMNVKPLKSDYEKVEQLAFAWNCSRREAVYRLLMNHIFVCEVDYHATK